MTRWNHRRGRRPGTRRRTVACAARAWAIAGYLAWLAAGGAVATVVSPAGAEESPPGLLAHWTFESLDKGRIADASGNARHGRIVGEPERVEGVRGQALRLDGLADHVVIPAADALDFSAATFSITAWVNVYGFRGDQQMILAKNVYDRNQREWGLMIDRDRRFRLYVRRDGQWRTLGSETSPVPGRWYQVAVTLDGGQAGLFVNGRLEAGADLGQPLPVTEAPLTIGGVDNAGRLMQQLFGAVDEIRLYDRAVSAEEIAAGYTPVSATHDLPQDPRYVLWEPDQPLPPAAEIPWLENVRFAVVKAREPEVDGYNWLHGAAVCWHGGLLYASFGHNRGSENTETEEARGRVSSDGGRTWGELFTMDPGEHNLAVSHGVFLSHEGRLWAFMGAFYDRFQRTHTRAYLRDEESGEWQGQGVVVDQGFWPMQEPIRMADGNWIMAGARVGRGYDLDHLPAVAISDGEDLTRWQMKVISKHVSVGSIWGESTVIVDGNWVMNISRYGGQPLALVAISEDYGRSWTESLASNLPMAASKPYAGTLSTGQHYLICTTTADSGNRRSPLTIALTRPGERVFSAVYRIRDAVHEGPGESHPNARLSYPYAVEHEGYLYVIYSNCGGRGANRNSAELAIIPLESLHVVAQTTLSRPAGHGRSIRSWAGPRLGCQTGPECSTAGNHRAAWP